jgi:hypothetical protein
MSGERDLSRWVEAASDELPGLARIVAGTTARGLAWTAGSSLRSALNDRKAAAELLNEVADDVAVASRAIAEVADAVAQGVPLSRALLDAGGTLASVLPEPPPPPEPEREPTLRERGERLLERSRDVWSDEEPHPAYARILDDLAPDEARILIHLLRDGPQPSVDVRTGGPVGMVSSTLVASGLTMIGARAGVRHGDEVPAYLNNLFRLGLVWFSGEQVEDPMDYQVLEAQPDVLAAMHSVRFARLVRRSIHLTPFGTNFCQTCLVDPVEVPDLPAHGAPED